MVKVSLGWMVIAAWQWPRVYEFSRCIMPSFGACGSKVDAQDGDVVAPDLASLPLAKRLRQGLGRLAGVDGVGENLLHPSVTISQRGLGLADRVGDVDADPLEILWASARREIPRPSSPGQTRSGRPRACRGRASIRWESRRRCAAAPAQAGQRAWNLGLRFSLKARTPSSRSSVTTSRL